MLFGACVSLGNTQNVHLYNSHPKCILKLRKYFLQDKIFVYIFDIFWICGGRLGNTQKFWAHQNRRPRLWGGHNSNFFSLREPFPRYRAFAHFAPAPPPPPSMSGSDMSLTRPNEGRNVSIPKVSLPFGARRVSVLGAFRCLAFTRKYPKCKLL